MRTEFKATGWSGGFVVNFIKLIISLTKTWLRCIFELHMND